MGEGVGTSGALVQRGAVPNVVTYDAAITSCENGLQWAKALELLVAWSSVAQSRTSLATTRRSIPARRPSEGEGAGSAGGYGAAWHGLGRRHLQRYDQFLREKAAAGEGTKDSGGHVAAWRDPDVVSHNAAISSCEKVRQWA